MLARLKGSGFLQRDREGLIRDSGLFDANWYAIRYPEAGSPEEALRHFLRIGAAQHYDPGPGFSMRAYLADNPDVANAGLNPLIHYIRFGRKEGRVARDLKGRLAGSSTDHGLGCEALARVKAAFDPAFYEATNPDLVEGSDGFAHFMGPGWRQGRDPAKWFSTSTYLASHADIAVRGENPFVHYVLTGCREGRDIVASNRTSYVGQRARGRLRLAALTMVKNEADVVRAFAGHVLALFDDLVIVDHGSTDGTSEFLADLAAGNARVTLLKLEEPSYIQSVTMTHLVRSMDVLRGADWVFPLDVDEFLPFTDRAGIETALRPFHRCPVLSMRWQNLVPAEYWKGPVLPGAEVDVLVPPALSPFRKVAFQPKRLPIDRTVVAQGNHAVLETANGLAVPAFDADFPLLHLPVRSSGQILAKLDQGVRAYRRMGGRRDGAQGTHWDQMRKALGNGTPDCGLLNAMAVGYSEPKDSLDPVDEAALLDAGFRHDLFAVASLADDELPAVEIPDPVRLNAFLDEETSHETQVKDCVAATRLRLVGDRLVRADGAPEYATLGEVARPQDGSDAIGILAELMRGSYREIADLMPDDWKGHVPFMLGLAGLFRPRRYVEIGTLWGSSFFALAQVARQARFECEAVAISGWAVEPERAAEFENVHETFQFVARKYASMTASLRMTTDEALHRFEDGSVDLLHLDGFRDYDDLARTWEEWRPKLSEQGLVLIHDIHAHGRGFGVWRIWDELRDKFPVIEFHHDQGLGLAMVGQNSPPGLVALAGAIGENADLRTMIQEHFERMGLISSELFTRRYDMAQAEMRAAAEGAQVEEIGALRQQLSAITAEAEGLRNLVLKEARHVG